jgi:cytochrome c
MESFEVTKVTGAVLLGGMVLLVSSLLAKNLVVTHDAHETAMAPAEGEGGGEQAGTAGGELAPIGPLLAKADVAAGETAFKKCATCHTIAKGDAAKKLGPNLWGVVGAPHAHVEGFAYSNALKDKQGEWDFESLNAWLYSPKDYAPGTKMTFAGVKKTDERAALIAWLNQQSDSPLPLPEAGAAPAPEQPATTETAPPAPAPSTQEAAPASPAPAPAPAPTTGEQTAALPGGGIADLLKAADPAAGEKVAAKCKACHSFDKGGAKKVGPNLWDIVGAKPAHSPDFTYSEAIKGLGKEWTYEELDKFLSAPKQYAPGTKMQFAGVKDAQDRAALIAYLRTLSDSPKPLP